MNVAENVGNTFAIEVHSLARTRLIKSQIETSPIEERKDIVKERVYVGELNGAPDGNYLKVRNKGPILLPEGVFPLRPELVRPGLRLKPDNNRNCSRAVFVRRRDDAKAYAARRLRVERTASKQNRSEGEFKCSLQKRYPAAAPITFELAGEPVVDAVVRCLYSIEKSRYELGE